MLSTKEETFDEVAEDNILTFYEKIKLKNNIESIFNHYTGSYVFIETNPWKDEYIIRGKFHVKYGIFSKFEILFEGIQKLRVFSDFIESLAFLKNTCEENVIPVLNNKGQLTFLYNGEQIDETKIETVLKEVKQVRATELFNINQEIKQLYSGIEEIDNDIKYKKEQIKTMEIKIKEVKEAASSFLSALKYITLSSQNSIMSKVRNIFRKEQLRLR